MSEFVISSAPARDRVQTRALPRVTNSVHAAKRGSVARKSFQFQMGFTVLRIERRAYSRGKYSVRQFAINGRIQFFPTISPDSIFVPCGLIKNSTRFSYFTRNISKNKMKKFKKIIKNENRFDTVSRADAIVLSQWPSSPSAVYVRGTSTYTRRLYDNGRASGWSPCFRCNCHHPVAHFSTLAL